jgi:hypothetical protein
MPVPAVRSRHIDAVLGTIRSHLGRVLVLLDRRRNRSINESGASWNSGDESTTPVPVRPLVLRLAARSEHQSIQSWTTASPRRTFDGSRDRTADGRCLEFLPSRPDKGSRRRRDPHRSACCDLGAPGVSDLSHSRPTPNEVRHAVLGRSSGPPAARSLLRKSAEVGVSDGVSGSTESLDRFRNRNAVPHAFLRHKSL